MCSTRSAYSNAMVEPHRNLPKSEWAELLVTPQGLSPTKCQKRHSRLRVWVSGNQSTKFGPQRGVFNY